MPPTQPPAAPENDVRLTEAERKALNRAQFLTPPTLEDNPVHAAVEHILRERVRVVEGERDAWETTARQAYDQHETEFARAESAEAALAELRAGVEALADDFESEIDWSNGRSSYGDNAAWESAARQLRALLGGAS